MVILVYDSVIEHYFGSVIEHYFGLACDHGNYFADKKEKVLLDREQNGF